MILNQGSLYKHQSLNPHDILVSKTGVARLNLKPSHHCQTYRLRRRGEAGSWTQVTDRAEHSIAAASKRGGVRSTKGARGIRAESCGEPRLGSKEQDSEPCELLDVGLKNSKVQPSSRKFQKEDV